MLYPINYFYLIYKVYKINLSLVSLGEQVIRIRQNISYISMNV